MIPQVNYQTQGQSGDFKSRRLPFLDHECAGIVQESGSTVRSLDPGDRDVLHLIELVAQRQVVLKELVAHSYSIGEAGTALRTVKQYQGKEYTPYMASTSLLTRKFLLRLELGFAVCHKFIECAHHQTASLQHCRQHKGPCSKARTVQGLRC